MELRLNLVLMVVLGLLWMGLRTTTPSSLLPDVDHAGLAALEDAFAHDNGNAKLVAQLADAYLEAEQPALAVVVLRSAKPGTLQQPKLSHRLARAYEDSGRLLDALATADLALARCGRVLGSTQAHTPTPSFDCTERTYATLDMHKSALSRMVRWGVVDPRIDPRARRAYQLSLRRARVAVSGSGVGATVR